MAWSRQTALDRIARLMASVPQTDIVVSEFTQYAQERRSLARAYLAESEVLLRIPRRRAVTTDAAHVYANLIGFNDQLAEAGRETEASHARAMQFLHLHYGACDNLIETFGMQRVDFHGPRLHAVALTPVGSENEVARVRKAAAFAAAFREMVERTANTYGSRFRTEVRVGIDTGVAIAMDSGRSDEAEPLFIGSPANHAAKLAAGDQPGIFFSPRARAVMGASNQFDQRSSVLAKSAEASLLSQSIEAGATASARLDEAYAAFERSIQESQGGTTQTLARFNFHHRAPPMKTIVYAEHPPSNAIRMPVASLFADLDGFTNYVDHALQNGRAAEAVRNLHVLRGEMAAVLRDDFGGRKVRFVGDCIHGLLAEGDARATNAPDTIETALLTAAGIRSSFELCRDRLPGVAELGIAIGVDFGPTPICRIGLRGEASVRCAASRATCQSEFEQQDCNGGETAISERAFAEAGIAVRQIFRHGRRLAGLNYPNTHRLLGHDAVAAPALSAGRAHAPTAPIRAHAR